MNSPKILYKYISAYSLEIILKDKTLKITNPTTFNDPFDCNIPSLLVNEKRIRTIVKRGLGDNFVVTKDFISGVASDMRLQSKSLCSDWNEHISKYRILSLTNDPKNILMWSHYADKHKGAVIGFNVDDNEIITLAKKVSYDDRGTTLIKLKENFLKDLIKNKNANDDIQNKICDDHANNFHKLLRSYFCIKKSEWEYEREYRVVLENTSEFIDSTGDLDLITFEGSDVHCVIFGLNMGTDMKASLNEIIRKNYTSSEVKNTVKDGWNLVIQDYKP